jgi:tetratricopeptide (TPR) repeat protein
MKRQHRIAALATLVSATLTALGAFGPLSGWERLGSGAIDEARALFVADQGQLAERFGSALGMAALHSAEGDLASEAKLLAQALTVETQDPLSAAVVARLSFLAPQLPDGGAELAPVLEPIARGARFVVDPEVQSLAIETLAEIWQRQGELERATQLLVDAAGRLTRYQLSGPYGRLDRLALWQPQAPERPGFDVASAAPEPTGHIPQRLEIDCADGRLVVPLVFHAVGVVFASSQFEAKTAGLYRVRASSPVSFRLFIDDRELLTADRVGARPAFSLAAETKLSAGPHRITVKLANAHRFPTLTVGIVASQADDHEKTPSAIDGPFDYERIDNGAALLAANWWLRARGLDREAGLALEAATRRWPDSPFWALQLGEHYRDAETGSAAEEDYELARQWLERAAKYPSWQRPRRLLAEMDDIAGRHQEAWDAASALTGERSSPELLQLIGRIAVRRGWWTEARSALETVAEIAPGRDASWRELKELYRKLGVSEPLTRAMQQLARRDAADDDWPDRLAELRRYDEALEAWDRLIAAQPGHVYGRLGRVRLLIDLNRYAEALDDLERMVELFPFEGLVHYRRAGVLSLLGREVDATAALKRALELEPSRQDWRAALIGRDAIAAWSEYLVDAESIIKQAPAPDAGIDSALLADISATEIDRYGGQSELYQGIHKVYTRDGVEHEGVLTVLPGARIEALRLHKPDGRTVDVEPNHRPLNLPGLEPGDAIEYVWRRYTAPLSYLPGAADNSTFWLFQNDDRSYQLTRYVLIHDPNLQVKTCGQLEGIEQNDALVRGSRVRDFVGRNLPVLRLEPHLADRTEVTKHLRLSMGASWNDVGDVVRAALLGTTIADAPFPELAKEIRRRAESNRPEALARALHQVVNERFRPGETALSLATPASVSASRGEGNRVTIALTLARSLGLDARLVFARTRDRKGRELDCPNSQIFGFALAEIVTDKGRYFLDYSDANQRFDWIPPVLEGSDALEVPLDTSLPVSLIQLPTRPRQILRDSTVKLRLAPNGTVDGTLRVTLRGGFAGFFRRLLNELPADRLELMWQSIAQETFAGSRVLAHRVRGANDDELDLDLEIDFAGGTYARSSSRGLELPTVLDPSRLLEEYGSFPQRRYPLLVDADLARRDRIELQLPANVRVDQLPAAVNLAPKFGSYRVEITHQDGQLILEREVQVPLQRIEPTDYQDFREFAQQIDQAERREVSVHD